MQGIYSNNSTDTYQSLVIIDDYYPKAVQHTIHKELSVQQDEDLIALDIAKYYRSVMFTNEHDIPLHNIHNTITKFDRELKTGEYYINETYIHTYRTLNDKPIIIEAAFYGRNLIDYLLEHKFIQLSDIKY